MMFRWIPRSGNGRHSSRLDGMMENVRLGAHRLHGSRPLPTGSKPNSSAMPRKQPATPMAVRFQSSWVGTLEYY